MIGTGPIRDAVRDLLDRLSPLDTDPERRQAAGFLLTRIVDPAEREALLGALKDESERYLGVDPHRALAIAEVLIFLAVDAGRPDHQAFGFTAKADALRSLGRYEESREHFVQAGDAFSAQGNGVGWARTRTGLLLVAQFLGRSAEVLPDVPRARAILIEHEQWVRAAGLSLNAGLAESELGRYDEAQARFDEALAMYERAAGSGQIAPPTAEIRSAKARGNKALVLTRRGDFRSALTLLEDARSVFAEHGETILVHSQDTFIADVYAGLGNYTWALHLYGKAFAGFSQADLGVDAAYVALKRVECYLRLNLDEVALGLAREAVASFERADSPTELAKARFYCALALARLGEKESAFDLLDAAARTFEEVDATGYLGVTLLRRAELHLTDRNWSAARADAERAREILIGRGMVVASAQADLTLGAIWLALERLDEAKRYARGALVVAGERDLAWLAQGAHHLLARIAREGGDDRGASTEYRASIASIERVQAALASELQTHFLGDKVSVYHEAIDLSLFQGQVDRAFEYLERAKSRALVDYLARHPDVRLRPGGRANPELAERLARLREEHHWAYHRLHGDGMAERSGTAAAAGGADLEDNSLLRAVIREREKQIGEIIEQQALERSDPGPGTSLLGDDRFSPPPLPPETVLLEYYCGSDRFGIFVWADSQLTFVPLSARPAEVRRLLNGWNLNLSATARAVAGGASLDALAQNAGKILDALGRALIEPIAANIMGRKRLIVIPHGVTHLAPFGALTHAGRFLIESLDVSICPSTSVLQLSAAHRLRNRQSALVFAYSAGGRLPGAVAEAETIARILPGAYFVEAAATREAFLREAERYGVIHLAAHGESRLDNPTFAHLELADGPLSPVDVFNLDLDGALVTLSGCATGQTVVAGGDELIGLSRGFLYAGAATLVQSLWRVEDHATSRLMGTFYRALAAGQPSGSALREAQLTLLDERGDHPFFWAPFQVVGDPGYLDLPRRS